MLDAFAARGPQRVLNVGGCHCDSHFGCDTQCFGYECVQIGRGAQTRQQRGRGEHSFTQLFYSFVVFLGMFWHGLDLSRIDRAVQIVRQWLVRLKLCVSASRHLRPTYQFC